MSVFFTSDLHIGHEFVAKLRGFNTVEDHDRHLADKWDRVVNPNGDRGDQVWVLGDISAGGSRAQTAALAWIMQRPGRKHLIVGNLVSEYFEVERGQTWWWKVGSSDDGLTSRDIPLPATLLTDGVVTRP